MATKSTPTFKNIMKGLSRDEIIVPALRSQLFDPEFKTFQVKVEGWTERPPTQWFSPSTHPLWPEKALYVYLTQPELLEREPWEPTSVLAVTAGSFFHTFVQTILLRSKVLESVGKNCPCGSTHSEAELFLVNEEVMVRGHADGKIFDGSLFEFKTLAPQRHLTAPKEGPKHPEMLEWYRTKFPAYYCQTQLYLGMAEVPQMIVVFVSLTYPFAMTEIHVPFDLQTYSGIMTKFMRVRQAVADQRPPLCEHAPDEVNCLARSACWQLNP